MNDQTQKFRIGLFVLGGVAVLLAMLFFFGLSNLFTHRAKVQSFFSESVQGLTVGSAVKYRGVPIGTVTRIVIRVSDKLVQVDMEVDFDTFVNNRVNGRLQQEREFRRFFQAELEQGMRCRLEYTGITGLRYIDFDYFATPGESLRERRRTPGKAECSTFPRSPPPSTICSKRWGLHWNGFHGCGSRKSPTAWNGV